MRWSRMKDRCLHQTSRSPARPEDGMLELLGAEVVDHLEVIQESHALHDQAFNR